LSNSSYLLNAEKQFTNALKETATHVCNAANRNQVSDVWVAGQHLLKSRELTTFDMTELQNNIEKWQLRLAEKTDE
jgi:5-methylthioadenosine/S-adenosylhomocysteine deaminase